MSKLMDKLRELDKVVTQPIGFKRAEVETKSLTMLLMVDIDGKTEVEVRKAMELGISGCVVKSGSLDANSSIKALSGVPVGLILDNNKPINAVKPEENNIDFVIFDLELPLVTLNEKRLGNPAKLLKLELNTEASLLSAVNNFYFPIDSVLVDLGVADMNIANILNCQRISDITGKPLIVQVNKLLETVELMWLRELGVKGVLLSEGFLFDDLTLMAGNIASLPKVVRHEKNRPVLLPRISSVAEEDTGNEDDE